MRSGDHFYLEPEPEGVQPDYRALREAARAFSPTAEAALDEVIELLVHARSRINSRVLELQSRKRTPGIKFSLEFEENELAKVDAAISKLKGGA